MVAALQFAEREVRKAVDEAADVFDRRDRIVPAMDQGNPRAIDLREKAWDVRRQERIEERPS